MRPRAAPTVHRSLLDDQSFRGTLTLSAFCWRHADAPRARPGIGSAAGAGGASREASSVAADAVDRDCQIDGLSTEGKCTSGFQHAATAIEEELSRHAASEDCANPACWSEETQDSPTFNIRTAPFGRGYFLGDYMGLDSDRSCAFLSRFASTDGIGPSSIFLAV